MSDLRARYVARHGSNPLPSGFVEALERELAIKLPPSFIATSEFFDGRGVCSLELHPMNLDIRSNVLEETQRLRNAIGLPARFVVLAEPPESLIVLDCGDGRVIWCDAIDAARVSEGPFSQPPNVWSQFSDFLAFLLDEDDAWEAGT